MGRATRYTRPPGGGDDRAAGDKERIQLDPNQPFPAGEEPATATGLWGWWWWWWQSPTILVYYYTTDSC